MIKERSHTLMKAIHEWIVEPGTCTIIVGGTSDDVSLEEGLTADVLVVRDRGR